MTKGSTNTNVIIFSTAAESTGSDIAYVPSSASGDSFLVHATGTYTVSYTTDSSNATIEIRVGSFVDNNAGDSSTRSVTQGAVADFVPASWTGRISTGQYIWIYNNYGASAPTNSNRNQITISKGMNP